MNNTTYINQQKITALNIYKKKKLKTVYPIHFKKKKFLWVDVRDECTRYATYKSATYENTSSTPYEAISYESVYINEIGKFLYVRDDNNAFEFDEKTNILYLKAYAIINVGGEKYLKFFDNDNDIQQYIKKLQIDKNLFGLEYDINKN